MSVNTKHPKFQRYSEAWDRAAKRSGSLPTLLACFDYRAGHASNYAQAGFFDDAIKILNEIESDKVSPEFGFAWLDEENTRLSVRYLGEVPTILDSEGNEVDDAGLIDWPSDSEISEAVGKKVVFADKGDDLTEAIFHAKENK